MSIPLQPERVNFNCYSKLRLFDLTDFIVWNRLFTAGYKDIGIKIIEHRVQRAFISTMTKSHKGIESLPQTKIFESQPNMM